MIIALTGEKLAGKGTVATYLEKYHAAKVLRFSKPLSDILTRLHQPNTRQELVALGTFLRQRFGDDVLAQVVARDASTLTGVVVIDGMRYQVEYDCFAQLPNFHLLNITAPLELRYQRTQQRSEKADEQAMTLAEFTAREQDITEQQIQIVQALADTTIRNTTTFSDLYAQLDKWLATLSQS